MLAPTFFVAHGSPMNAVNTNSFTKSLQDVAMFMKKPKAILIVSAHWSTKGSRIALHNNLLYDMYGFPKELYEVEYPAPNAEFLIPKLQELIPEVKVENRDLDHGVWSILLHMFPNADVPVMQLCINTELSMLEHFQIGQQLQALRKENVLILGSGNITHNLGEVNFNPDAPTVEWAKEFDTFIKNTLKKRDFQTLIEFEKNRYAKIAHPTNEHFIPLLYVAGTSMDSDMSEFSYEGFEHGSLSMRCWFNGTL